MIIIFIFSLIGRVPYGLEVILGAFSYGTKRPLTELHILDAGTIIIKIMVVTV